jgi:hypothetical protein
MRPAPVISDGKKDIRRLLSGPVAGCQQYRDQMEHHEMKMRIGKFKKFHSFKFL